MRAWVLRYWSSPGIGLVEVDGRSPDGVRLHVAEGRTTGGVTLPREWFGSGEWTDRPGCILAMVQADRARKLEALARREDEVKRMADRASFFVCGQAVEWGPEAAAAETAIDMLSQPVRLMVSRPASGRGPFGAKQ